jgi:prepilin-type N-terminal cleavage/methylation domain-containing protein
VVRRSAFTLIELIFAIVVISITVVSLPMMNQVINKGTEANLVQEAIFAASTELTEAVAANWDANSTESGTSFYTRVIDINGNCDVTSRLMPGHIDQLLHRRCLDSTTTQATDTTTVAGNTLNDMAHSSQNIFVDNSTNQAGYKKNYSSTLVVSRPAFFNGANNSNIKKLVITIQDDNNDTIVLLNTYSANIGEVDYYKRAYQ